MQMFLSDPFEEDFNVPAMAVDVGDFNGGEVNVVGHKGDDFATIGIRHLHQLFPYIIFHTETGLIRTESSRFKRF